MQKTDKKIVCLGGGIGTVNLLKGLKEYTDDFSVVISMADDGGSAGRLRRLYNIFPPGDLVSCMAALADADQAKTAELLTYRFPGDRYGRDDALGGHKVGNLVLTALLDLTKNLEKAIAVYKDIFKVKGSFYPATSVPVSISAKTSTGDMVEREENIDLGRYKGKLEQVFLHPTNAPAIPELIEKIKTADLIIAGPGDLYTTILPVLIVKDIAAALQESKAQKMFVVNVANKPFETKGYSLSDYLHALEKHLGSFPFDMVIGNDNYALPIPKKYKYTYVKNDITGKSPFKTTVVMADLVDETFPLYHSPTKLAKLVAKYI